MLGYINVLKQAKVEGISTVEYFGVDSDEECFEFFGNVEGQVESQLS
jgi:hypothetical protein